MVFPIKARNLQRRIPSAPRIDWSHPLTNGLIACWIPSAFGFDLVTPSLPRIVGTLGADQEGVSFLSPTGGNSTMLEMPAGHDIPNTSPIVTAPKISFYQRGFQYGAAAEGNGCIISFNDGVGAPYFCFGTDTTGGINRRLVYSDLSSNYLQQNFVGNVTPPTRYGVGASLDFTANPIAYRTFLNGRLDLSAAAGVGGSRAVAPTGRFFMQSANNATLNCFYVWKRLLGNQEFLWIHNEPYSFLTPGVGVPLGWIPRPMAAFHARYYYDMNRSQHV